MKLMGMNIKRRRKARGLTQQRLADLVGTHQVYIAEIESGKAVPSLQMLERIAKALRTSSSALLRK